MIKMHNRELRDSYLKTQWARYPAAGELKAAGRVLELDASSILIFGTTKTIRFEKKEIRNWTDISPILTPGDIVGIHPGGQCILLAPWRGDLGGTYNEQDARVVLKKVTRQQNWNQFLVGINQFFLKNEFLSVQTPSLVDNPGPEPTLDVFKTLYKAGKERRDKFLITSPELHLKKLVSETLTPIYEITKVYRNNEHSNRHLPEFWMLEWYRPFVSLDAVVQDVKDLIAYLRKHLSLKSKAPSFESTTFQKVLKDQYGFQFKPETTAADLTKCLTQNKIHVTDGLSLDDLFTLVNIELIETKLEPNQVTFLSQYPPYAAALAKLDNKGWAERFEVYWKGLELGNAFHELNDPDIQIQRMADDNVKKQANGLEPLPLDYEFIECLKRGMPPTAGISIGLERLFMALYDESEIKNLKWF